MATSNCPSCSGSLAKSANGCPGCGHVPVLVRVRSFILAVIAGSWAIIAYAGPNAPLSPLVQNATNVMMAFFVALIALLASSLVS